MTFIGLPELISGAESDPYNVRHFCGGRSKKGSCGGLPPFPSSGHVRKGYPPVPSPRLHVPTNTTCPFPRAPDSRVDKPRNLAYLSRMPFPFDPRTLRHAVLSLPPFHPLDFQPTIGSGVTMTIHV
jgi:hypothetical protein